MLYTTTRTKTDSYTAYRALYENRTPDGGFYVPFRIGEIIDLESVAEQPFNSVVTKILNLFFPGRITKWDIECCIGKSACNILSMPHRVLLAQLWNNPAGDASYIYQAINNKLCKEDSGKPLSDWAKLAIKVSLLFAIYGQLRKLGIQQFDIAVNAGDFNTPMAAWYARKMGLPIGMIICGCNENGTPWDFIHRGELNTGAAVITTLTKELDFGYPVGVERLIYEIFGIEEVKKFLCVCEKNGIYQLRSDMLLQINKGLFASVIGNERVETLISSVYRANQCILDPYTAVSYGGLQDYRSKTGESCPTLLLAEKSPLQFAAVIQRATGLTDIRKSLN